MKKESSLVNKKAIEGATLTVGGSAITSGAPKYVGYKEEKDGGSNKARALFMGLGAGVTSLAFSPRRVLPKPLIKKIVRKGHKNKLDYLENKSPYIGAIWGAGSGLSSYEAGRGAKKLKEQYDMEKKAGMIDPVQKTLPTDIFDENQKMHPHVRKYFMDELATQVDLDRVEKLILIGGIASFQYSDTSDIDLSVFIKNPPEEWIGSEKSEIAHDISYKILPGTKREYQYYVVPWNKDTAKGLANRSFGSYDIFEDRWYTPPRPRESYVPPETKFKSELVIARHQFRNLEKKVGAFRTAKRAYKSYKKDRYTNPRWSPIMMTYRERKAQHALKDLVEFSKKIFGERSHRYSLGWGIPRNARENVIFKLLEYSPHKEIFFQAAKTELPPKVEEININIL